VSGFGQPGNPYDELGVTTVINCEGTMTMPGGSILRPELEAVMAMAGRHFVSIPDLDVAAVEHAGMRTRRLQFVAKRSRSEK
jgi:seryl-tRNA(Sec) selenium transferase